MGNGTVDPVNEGASFWLGTDDQGRDVLARLIYGFRISVLFGLTLTFFSSIVGVAAGGIPVDFAHNLDYINGSSGWSGIIPAVLVALSRAYGVDLTAFLSPYGVQPTDPVAHACIGPFHGRSPRPIRT